jgi:glycerol-3-phosphate acyltransferase PlsY
VGSGNAGATNTVRALGKKYGILVFFLDFFKGVIAVVIGNFFDVGCYCAVLSVIGHIFPVYFKFKGGKGVSTAYGALAVLSVFSALICGVIILLMILVVKIVSISSLTSFLLMPFVYIALNKFVINDTFICICIISVLVFYSHRSNISRLIKGNENSFSKKGK